MKDYYSILRVSPTATQEEIRKSYLLLSKMFHPDKFSAVDQPNEWKKSNEIFQDLNEAYTTLKDASSRAKYDNSISDSFKKENQSSSKSKGTKTSYKQNLHRTVLFDSLPSHIKDRIKNLVNNKRKDSIKLNYNAPISHWIGSLIAFALFSYNLISTYSIRWDYREVGIHILINIFSFLWFSFHLYNLINYYKSGLRKALFLTRAYLIQTNLDRLTFHWLRDITDFRITHNHKNNNYENTSVYIGFPDANYSFTLYSKAEASKMKKHIEDSNRIITDLMQNNDWSKLSELDDFASVSPEIQTPSKKYINKKLIGNINKYIIPLFIFFSFFIVFLNFAFDDVYAWNQANKNHNYESYRGYLAQSKAGFHKGSYIHQADDKAYGIIKG